MKKVYNFEDSNYSADHAGLNDKNLELIPFVIKRTIKIYLKHMRNELDRDFILNIKKAFKSRHDVIACEILN